METLFYIAVRYWTMKGLSRRRKPMEKVDLLIQPINIITVNEKRQEIENGMVAVKDGRFVYVGEAIDKQYESDHVIDGTGKFLFPGFVNPHAHLFQMLLKGLGRDKYLLDWLNASVYKALPKIKYEDVLAAATAGCMENIKSGVTTIVDFMYCHGTSLDQLDNAVLDAFDKTKIRGYLARGHVGVSELGCPVNETEEQSFEQVERLAALLEGDERKGLVVNPSIIWEHSPQGFEKCRAYADQYKVPLTMHTIETDDDDAYALENFGDTTMAFLDKHGVLGPDFLAVHCVKASDEDIEIMAKNDVKVIHCPVSNMILASGFAPIRKYKEAGITIGLATDGAGSNDSQNYLETLKFAAIMHKGFEMDPTFLPAYEVLEMATINGAKCMGLENEIGSIEVGKKSDCFIYNGGRSLTATALHNAVNNLMYASTMDNIETVIVGGDIIIEDGRFAFLDEQAVIDQLQERAMCLING